MPLTDEQKRNAEVIVSVGRSLGASDRDLQIALMTALQESGLRNINYGDRDSIGLFQQRDAWGTTAQRLDPAASARMFFLGGNAGQRGLLDFANRDQLSLTQAAQAVQVSAFPDAYAKHEGEASAFLSTLGGTSGDSISMGTSPTGPTLTDPTAGGDVTVNPTLDRTAGALAAQQRDALGSVESLASAGKTPVGRAATPGVGAAVAPVGAVSTPAAAAAGSMAADLAPPAPQAPVTYSREQFAELFPDAAATKMFTGATTTNQRRSDLISTASTYIGTPYVWGGVDSSGVDCSGLIQAVYKNFGIDLPRLSADQARSGIVTSIDNLLPGDLVAVDNSSRNNGADHIAIYAGDGYIIEAPRAGLNVRRRKLTASEMQSWYGVSLAQLG